MPYDYTSIEAGNAEVADEQRLTEIENEYLDDILDSVHAVAILVQHGADAELIWEQVEDGFREKVPSADVDDVNRLLDREFKNNFKDAWEERCDRNAVRIERLAQKVA